MSEDRPGNRQIPLFSLAETVSVSSTQRESSHGIVPRSDGVRSKRWLRSGSDAFTGLSAVRCRTDWKETLVQSSASARQQLGALIKLGPEGDGTCDHNPTERAINIITSLPYFALGLNTFSAAASFSKNKAMLPMLRRKAQSKETKLYGASVMGVGVGAVAFHASSGKLRHWGRKLDYWVISAATAALLRAVCPEVSRHKTGASLLLTPLQPLAVTSANTAGVEVEYLRQAKNNPDLRPAHRVHLGTGAIGAGVFFLEYAYPTAPLIHTVWHGLSAVSLWSLNALVEDADRRKAEGQFLLK